MIKYCLTTLFLASLSLPLLGQPKEVTITVLGNPREFVEIAMTKNLTVRQALDQAFPKSGIQFVVVARRADTWVGEARNSVERRILIANTAVIAADAAQIPVPYETAPTIGSIKRKLATEFSGDAVFRLQYLTDASVGVETQKVPIAGIPPIYRPILSDSREKGNTTAPLVVRKDDSDGPANPADVLGNLAWIVLILCGSGLCIFFWLKHREKKKESIRKTLEDIEEVNSKKEQDLRFKRLILHNAHTFLNCILIAHLVSSASTAVAQPSPDSRKKIVALDVSGSATWMSQIAKEMIAADILRGEHPSFWITGDSTRFVKEIRTLSELDSVFARLPVDRRTLLSESYASLVRVTAAARKKGQKVCAVFVSDWDPDDNDNAALKYLPSVAGTPSDSLTLAPVTSVQKSTESDLEIVLLTIFGALITFLVVVLFTRKRREYGTIKRVVFSNGKRRIEFKPEELMQRKIKVANTVDADLRVFDDREQFVQINAKPGNVMLVLEQPHAEPLTISLNERS